MSNPKRRSLIKGAMAALALRPGFGLTALAIQDTLPLREPLTISRADLSEAGGVLAFDAWFRLDDRDRLVGGVLVDLDQEPNDTAHGLPGPTLAAFVSNCPHEACKVRLESDPEILAQAAAGVTLPTGPVFLCPCHFSLFDARNSGMRITGPAYRGLYRFVLSERGSSIVVHRIERAVIALFG